MLAYHEVVNELYAKRLQFIAEAQEHKGPGKFEGMDDSTRAIALYFYDAMMNGDGELIESDDCGGPSTTAFALENTDRLIFPELSEDNATYAYLHESTQGFISVWWDAGDDYKAAPDTSDNSDN